MIVIDEFSRTDPARVLGEAMTYMEKSLRGQEFQSAFRPKDEHSA